ncbi:hypothetical protein PFBG_05892 [Plasmodium falciparum 7G8]|uniref:Rifin n=1 Tax=Plasmodium falciparum (isolate 7G8) TaxID=57266 RepID=W7ETP6_PLAF8|nr:hypothetical protein PFBG_05892 [Plasmodium falciparum 7G8]
MKVHYINILLFSLPLNILEHNPWNHYMKPHTYTNRSLCECDLYIPNYDNDAQMKEVMENFNKQTQQRFHEYDERMKTTRQKCKDQCDKEIQKIILKDKLEKQMEQHFNMLHTEIQSDAIPTCVCEKSIADKVEKGCLRCGGVLGGTLPELGLICGTALYTLNAWKPLALKAATEEAITEATSLATKAGINTVVSKIKGLLAAFDGDKGLFDLTKIVTPSTFDNGPALFKSAEELANGICIVNGKDIDGSSFCSTILRGDTTHFGPYAKAGRSTFEATLTTKTAEFKGANIGAVDAKYAFWQTANIAPVVAIVVIVLIMVIIYLILRYRRKKKMKKKLQYIKLLEE